MGIRLEETREYGRGRMDQDDRHHLLSEEALARKGQQPLNQNKTLRGVSD